MSEDKVYKEIHKLITKDITLPFEYPLPCSQPARLTPIPEDQHRDFEMFTEKHTVHTPIIELVCHDLLKAALSEEQVVVQKKEKKKEMIDIQVDKEICYEEIVRDSFQFVDSEIVHPFAPDVEVEEVYDLFPDTKNLENKYDIISVVDNENMGDFEAIGDEKIPSGIVMNGNEYGCTAMDISDYVYVSIVDSKAVYNEIGANIKLHRKNN